MPRNAFAPAWTHRSGRCRAYRRPVSVSSTSIAAPCWNATYRRPSDTVVTRQQVANLGDHHARHEPRRTGRYERFRGCAVMRVVAVGGGDQRAGVNQDHQALGNSERKISPECSARSAGSIEAREERRQLLLSDGIRSVAIDNHDVESLPGLHAVAAKLGHQLSVVAWHDQIPFVGCVGRAHAQRVAMVGYDGRDAGASQRPTRGTMPRARPAPVARWATRTIPYSHRSSRDPATSCQRGGRYPVLGSPPGWGRASDVCRQQAQRLSARGHNTEVPLVESQHAADAMALCQHHDRCIDEADLKVGAALDDRVRADVARARPPLQQRRA